MRRDRPTVPLRSSLDAVLAHLGRPTLQALEVVSTEWTTLVGGALSTRSHPVDLDDETLIVEVVDSVSARALTGMGHDLVRSVNLLVGEDVVGALRVRVRRDGRSAGTLRDMGSDSAEGI